MQTESETHGSIDAALAHAARMLPTRPDLAAEQAEEVLAAVPHQPNALLLLSLAKRARGDAEGAASLLETLCDAHPNWGAAYYEYGAVLGSLGRGADAIVALRRAVELDPRLTMAWLALGDHLRGVGAPGEADAAYAMHIRTSVTDARLLAAGEALHKNDIPQAELLLRAHLKERPTDVAAIRMFAEVAVRIGRLKDAENLLARCLELAPSFDAARHNYASVLHRQNRPAEALLEVERLLQADPKNPGHRNLKAAILTRVGDYDGAIDLYAGVLADYPDHAKVWMNYGHALKTADREAYSIAAYRRCISLDPQSGEAYWSLANLKTFRFARAEIEAIERQLLDRGLGEEERFHFHFALGKALEDEKAFGDAFSHYADGNRIRRSMQPYDPDNTTGMVERSRAIFTPAFFEERSGHGCRDKDPIFIIGMPRAGSTLIEQILSSHPEVEGTMELSDLALISRTLPSGGGGEDRARYPQMLGDLSADECRDLGERYLAQTRIQRKTDAPFFIDKMPNNWAHVGLIQLALPNAKIIDARRHPLGCCLSVFKQHFARGQAFAYDLDDIGRYYRDYVALMRHFAEVLPGRVHRVNYESLVDDPDREVRQILDYCGLPFDANCLRFYENKRAVRTASSQQVRKPIFRDGVEHWRHFEQWLEPLKQALGPALSI